MESERGSGDLLGSDTTTTSSGNNNTESTSSSDDGSQAPKRRKLEDGSASVEKPVATAAQLTVPKGSTPTLLEKPHLNPWSKLLSQSGQYVNLIISTPTYNIGSGENAGLLCKITRDQYSGDAVLEVTGDKGSVRCNGKDLQINSKCSLQSGDEVVLVSRAFVS